MESCPGCGAVFPETMGPTHRYMESSPGCWAAYGEVLAREYSDPPLFERVHQLTVHAYAVQHPGRPSPQSVQSVAVHLIGLCLRLERGAQAEEWVKALQTATGKKGGFRWLPPPEPMKAVTVADVWRVRTSAEHEVAVRRWAEAAWSAWSAHHETVRTWVR